MTDNCCLSYSYMSNECKWNKITVLATVKPEISACPLFREFRDLSKFAKITGHEYSNGNLVYCITGSSASKNAKIKGAKIIL